MKVSTHNILLPLLLLLIPRFLIAAEDVAAPGPASPDLNLTRVLEKGGQYTKLLRLLRATRIGEQLASQLKSSYDGLTVFAPTDNAFAKLDAAGALSGLTDEQRVQLLLSHVLPRYYSLTTFRSASNPLRTEGSARGCVYSVNVTTSSPSSHRVSVSTGAAAAVPISTTVFAEFPLAVYSVDAVLRPEQLFGGASHSASAPAPAGQVGAAARKKGAQKSGVAAEPSPAGAEEDEDSTNNAAALTRNVEWSIAAVLLLMDVVNLVGA